MSEGSLDQGLFVNYVLSLLLRKIVVPSGYHDQVKAVKQMQMDDVSGLVDSLTDFAVQSASVEFDVETDSEEFTSILREWLNERINIEYNGKIPIGINALAEEYYKERWKSSSFPVLKIDKWDNIKGVIVPTQMYFVDGGSIYSKDINEKDDNLKVLNYDYYLGSKLEASNKLDKNCIFAKCFGRWYEEYPTPYLIKRGVYHNWKIIQAIKKNETQILDQLIPYLLSIKKGTEALALQNVKTYSDPELKQVIADMQSLMDEIKGTKLSDKQVQSPIRATMFDEEIKHLIPDVSAMFDAKIFTVAERGILSGLGFIDIAEAVSSSRKESVLNPKAFITEIKSGVKDFKNHILKLLILKIKEKNKDRKKYINSNFYMTHSPVKTFMTENFKDKIRQLYDRGRISSQTAVELIAEIDFRTEVHRREKETKQGIETKMFPVIVRNDEGKGEIDNPKKPSNIDKNDKEIPDKKTDKTEKQEYDMGAKKPDINLEGAPYPSIQSLPTNIKKLSLKKQRAFMKAWNRAYYYKLAKTKNKKLAETYAFKVAYSVIKRIK